MICTGRDGRVSVDALQTSQKTSLSRQLIVVMMLHRVSEKVTETDGTTHKSVLVSRIFLMGEQNYGILFCRKLWNMLTGGDPLPVRVISEF
jgi:hypothetical protein